jgi:hypothetical protein
MEDHLSAAELPVELLAECLALLPRFRDLLACACVSRHWNIASGTYFYTFLYMGAPKSTL